MSSRRKLERHRQNMAEIREIMNSMKTLAYMETHTLQHFIQAQQAVVKNIEQAAADLLSFHPEIMATIDNATPVYILIGSERGFCGDFNHALQRALASSLQELPAGKTPLLIGVGRKLFTLLEAEQEPHLVASITGASVADETGTVITSLVEQLSLLNDEHGLLNVRCIYHSTDGHIACATILPPFQNLSAPESVFRSPPVLNLPAQDVLIELTDHYLLSVLYQMIYLSLMEENQFRVSHLDGAVKHLDKQAAELTRKSYQLRQEEIVEEIEVILLSAASLGGKAGEADTGHREN